MKDKGGHKAIMGDLVKNAAPFVPNIGSAVNGGVLLAALVGTVIITILIIGILIVRMRKSKDILSTRTKKTAVAAISFLMIVLIVCNGAVYRFGSVINIWFSGFTEHSEQMEEATKNSLAQMEKVMEEGAVLLKNENETLPLMGENSKKINVFGLYSEKLNYTNHFNGDINDENRITLEEGLTAEGFEMNPELTEFYRNKAEAIEREDVSIFDLTNRSYDIYEVPAEEYEDSVIENAKEFSDTALVVISRKGGEGADLAYDMADYHGGDAGKHYLELQQTEIDMLKMVTESFDKVVVLVNSASAMEMGFLDEMGIDAALWIANPGDTGCEAVAKILAGEVNPSGRLVDTWAYDATSAPSYYNLGNFVYTNCKFQEEGSGGMGAPSGEYSPFMDYAEGIYVGYRYYETRWIDNKTGECDEKAYRSAVQYPFGYGLSYTEFEQKIETYEQNDSVITMDVKVTNTGSAAGKEVAQIYFTAPYYEGGIEKSHVVLCAFDKTKLLEPGESEVLSLSFAVEDMASYDYAGEKAYVLDEGDYEIKLMKNAHDVIDSRICTIEDKVIYNDENDGKRNSDFTEAVNQFDDTTYGEEVEWVSRADWEGTLPDKMCTDREASKELAEKLVNYDVIYEDAGSSDGFIVEDHGILLKELEGLDYDDEKWTEFMEQVTVDEMVNMVGYGGWQTPPIKRLGVPSMNCVDGPGGIDNYVNNESGCSWLAQTVWAATWDTEFIEETAEIWAAEFHAFGYDGIYGGGNNIHRSPFSGRNFEYFAEDGFLSGKMAAATVSGAYENKVVVFMKHFAVNDQETNRNVNGLCTWVNEQAIREIYLKAFELPAKEAPMMALMGAFNRIGSTWAEGYPELNYNVLREEWGFDGTILTDANVFEGDTPYMGPDILIAGGGNLNEATTGYTVTEQTTNSLTGLNNLREAIHGALYTLVNSSAMEEKPATGIWWWPYLLCGIDTILLLAAGAAIMRITKKKEDAVEK